MPATPSLSSALTVRGCVTFTALTHSKIFLSPCIIHINSYVKVIMKV